MMMRNAHLVEGNKVFGDVSLELTKMHVIFFTVKLCIILHFSYFYKDGNNIVNMGENLNTCERSLKKRKNLLACSPIKQTCATFTLIISYLFVIFFHFVFTNLLYLYNSFGYMQILEETLKKSKAITNLQDETNEKSAGKHFYKNIFKK